MENSYLDKKGLAYYESIQKQRFTSMATLENQEYIIGQIGSLTEKFEIFQGNAESLYEDFAKRLEELV